MAGAGHASYSRRRLLARAGLGAGAVVAGSSAAGVVARPVAAAAAPAAGSPGPAAESSLRFGRLFPRLAPFAQATPAVRQALLALGAPGGPLDARDDLSAGPVSLLTDERLSAGNPDNPTHTAGTHFFGQFVDHDITFDTISRLGVPTDPSASPNGRTPSLDLDSVYGGGPAASPALYDRDDPAKLAIGTGGVFEDLPRQPDGTAIVADPRNDQHLMVAGLHCACILFHDRAVDEARAAGAQSWQEAFTRARRLTTWHYQWLVVHELLPLFVGQALVDDVVVRGPRLYRPAAGAASMPVEFSGACYRFGHSMVRPSYRANLKGDAGKPFFGLVFDPAETGGGDPGDLRGGFRAPRRFIGWQTFFDFGDGEVKPNKRIDTRISSPLFALPQASIATHDQPLALAQRTLLRHLTWSLPSGQAVAAAAGAVPLSRADLRELEPYSLDRSTPLWYYVLKEAEVVEDGLRLGPSGGRIVAEVLIGLLRADPQSYLAAAPSWRPTLASNGRFAMTDFLAYAGVDPATRRARRPDLA